MSPDDFLRQVWVNWSDRKGMTLPLPENWRIRVAIIPADADDWDFAVRKAIEAMDRRWDPVKPAQVFNYAVGILWNRLGERSPLDSRATKPFLVDPAAEMKATADALAAEIAEQERREKQAADWARTDAIAQERTKVIMERVRAVPDLVRREPSLIHRSTCRLLRKPMPPYEVQPEDNEYDLCRACFGPEIRGQGKHTLRVMEDSE